MIENQSQHAPTRIYAIAKEMLGLFELLEDTLRHGRRGDVEDTEWKEYRARRKRVRELRTELGKFISRPS